MAEAVAAALAAAGATSAAATIGAYAAWINLAIAVAGSAYSAKEQRRRARNAKRDAARDREITVRSAADPLRYIYGASRVAGHVVDVFTSGQHSEYLHTAIRIADHQCGAIVGVWFAGQRLTIDGQGYVTNPDFTRRTATPRSYSLTTDAAGTLTLPLPSASQPVVTLQLPDDGGPQLVNVSHTLGTSTIPGLLGSTTYQVDYTSTTVDPLIRVRTHLGQPGQIADPLLVAESAGRWTNTMRATGITWAYVRIEFDPVLAAYDPADWLFEVHGKPVYDPRINITQPTANLALCWRDWMLDPRVGPGIAAADLPVDEIIAAANVCDEPIRTQHIYLAAYAEHFRVDLGGWTSNASTTVANGAVTVRNANDPQISKGGLSINGALNRYVRARLRRTAGSGWQGTCYYSHGGHGTSESFKKDVPAPVGNAWTVVEWDMHALTAGGIDWAQNVIGGIRLDLGTTTADAFEVDWIAIGGTLDQPRYTFGGVVTAAQPLGEILDQFADACAGSAVYAQGRWLMRPGAHRIPALTINEASISGEAPVRIVPVPKKRARYNAVRAYYSGPDTDYVTVPAPIVRNAQYVAEDGGVEVVHDLRLATHCDMTRAQRLAKIELERGRQGLTAALTTNMRAYDLVPTDTSVVDLVLPGFASKVFSVDSRTWAGAGQIQYQLTETAAAVWEWNDGQATVGDLAPNTNLRSPSTPPARITGLLLSAADVHRLRLSDDSYQRRLRVSWDAVTDTYVTQGGRIEIETWDPPSTVMRALPSEPGDSSGTYIAPIQRGVIGVRVRAVNAIGVAGGWSSGAAAVEDQPATSTQVIVMNMDAGDLLAPSIQARWRRSSAGIATDFVFRNPGPNRSITEPFVLLGQENFTARTMFVVISGHWTGRGITFGLAGVAVRVDLRVTIERLSPPAIISIDPTFTPPSDAGAGFALIDPSPPALPGGGQAYTVLKGDVSRQYELPAGHRLTAGLMFYSLRPAQSAGVADEVVAEITNYFIRGEGTFPNLVIVG